MFVFVNSRFRTLTWYRLSFFVHNSPVLYTNPLYALPLACVFMPTFLYKTELKQTIRFIGKALSTAQPVSSQKIRLQLCPCFGSVPLPQ